MKTSNHRFRSVEKGSNRNQERNINNRDRENHFDDNDDDYQRFSSYGRNRNNGYPDDFERDYYGYEDNFDPEDSDQERRESRSSGRVNRERHYFGNGNSNNYGASNNYGHGTNYNDREYGAGDNYNRNEEWDNDDDRDNDHRSYHNNERGSWGGRLNSFYDEDTYDHRHEFNDEHSMDSGRNSISKRYNNSSSERRGTHRYQNENAGNISDRELSGRTSRRSSSNNRRRRR